MRINNRFIYGIISILLAAVIAFVAIPVVTKKTSSTLEIVRVVNPLERGQQITAQDLELIEVGSYNLPASVAIRLEDVTGTYAAASLMPGDYILPIRSVPLLCLPILRSIPFLMVWLPYLLPHRRWRLLYRINFSLEILSAFTTIMTSMSS